MSNTLLGLDIGGSTVKLAVISGGRIQKLATAPLPEHLMRDGRILSADALAGALRTALRAQHIRAKRCALVLPPEAAFVRRITVPYMTVEQLRVNLPYEFHDYIQKEKEQYFYDYAVLDIRKNEAGEPEELELLAAAAPKARVEEYRVALKKAGLKLTLAVPEYLAYRNLIRTYERTQGSHPAEYCIVDMGHNAIRMHMYRGDAYETSRVIEYGGAALDGLIADARSVDPHVAAEDKVANRDGVQELPVCQELYSRIAVEILRAINFYGFNNPDSNLKDLYFCGGLAKIPALMAEIRRAVELELHSVEVLMPDSNSKENSVLCPAAVGAALQSNGR